jgi:putative ABC transport system permease protein
MLNDLRDAFRALRRAPAFSLVAVVTLALAIGGATAAFSIVDAVLVRGLPYASPARLQTVYERRDDGRQRLPSYPTVKDWQDQAASVGDAIEGFAFIRGDGVTLPAPDGGETQIAAFVTPGFFQLAGSRPLAGRAFSTDEEQPGAPRVCVISYAYFTHHFGGDPSILGATLAVDSVPTTIIGVMPRGFAYPNFGGVGAWFPPALWEPIGPALATKPALLQRGLHVDSRTLLRLRPGVDSARAAAAMHVLEQRLATTYPADQGHWTAVELRAISDEMFGQLGPTLALVAGAIGFVLLLACANVANLLLVRASVRGRELAVRAALGAGGWRLARHLLAEALVIAVIAAALGAAVASGIIVAIRPYAATRLPFAADFRVDAAAIWFTIGVCAATTLLIGALPALHASRNDLVGRLRSAAAAVAGTRAERRARDLLVALQLALAITVLIGAGLLIQSMRRLSDVELGFDDAGTISFTIAPPNGRYASPADAAALYQRIIEATRSAPTVVQSAAAGGALLPTKVETDAQRGSTAPPVALYHPISADFLAMMRIPIVAGRGFTRDDMRSPSGFLVTQNLAKRLWPNGAAVGQRVTVYRQSQARSDFGQPITLPVVGVVADYREFGPESDPPEQVFLPYTLEVWPWMQFTVRAANPASALPAITRAVQDVEPAIVFRNKPSIAQSGFAAAVGKPRLFVASLMSGFAALALLLAAIGLYGIIAYGVAQRTRELGVRIALGATSSNILSLVFVQSAKLVVAGIAVGLLSAAGATRLLHAMLFQTTPTDATTFIIVPLALALVAALASLAPALRATRTDPIVAIRAE